MDYYLIWWCQLNFDKIVTKQRIDKQIQKNLQIYLIWFFWSIYFLADKGSADYFYILILVFLQKLSFEFFCWINIFTKSKYQIITLFSKHFCYSYEKVIKTQTLVFVIVYEKSTEIQAQTIKKIPEPMPRVPPVIIATGWFLDVIFEFFPKLV